MTLNSGTSITNLATADSITVDCGATLTLDDTSKIVGGTITVDSGGTLTMAGSAEQHRSGLAHDGTGREKTPSTCPVDAEHDRGRHDLAATPLPFDGAR